MSAEELPPRESMEFDVVIVGAGIAGSWLTGLFGGSSTPVPS